MKLQRSKARLRSDDDRVLPLINIVFLLLIFFMVAGRLSETEVFEVTPAVSESQKASEQVEIRILIDPDGRVGLNGQEVDLSSLSGQLGALFDGEVRQSPEIKADGRTDSAHVVTVMEALRDAGFESVNLITAHVGQVQ